MIIETSAPTRVDLAGGTIDIPPLYLFHEGAATVNFAVSLLAHCRIETRSDSRVILRSIDQERVVETTLADIDSLRDESELQLLSKLAYFFRPEVGFEMTTRSEAPAGAGLAGSSTLNIACIAALNKLVGDRYSPDRFIQIAANVECQVIRVPTGYQDYYSAQYGGVAAIHFGPDGIRREGLAIDLETLERRVAVCYTGEPRNSGTNNWEITKRHIDGDRELFEIFDGIRDTSIELRKALLASDWDAAGEILAKAHPERKRLSPHITTPHMDALIEAALAAGAIAPKVCGAGGGGCIAFFTEDGKRSDVEATLAAQDGCRVLEWRPNLDGLTLKVTD
ncbi:MAG: GHMP kinase [Acidobacteria bacterium ACB1]|nr:D-glycero-alpha-D-manno-heptose 7-phosphate kinase [Pyrinomonadaceae bacterium]MCE7962797.1 GHMP kinase [Acidobacteria bacterium ACB1]RIJ95833.1 MAG: GHMP kinase [Acidobacteriota bacterium]